MTPPHRQITPSPFGPRKLVAVWLTKRLGAANWTHLPACGTVPTSPGSSTAHPTEGVHHATILPYSHPRSLAEYGHHDRRTALGTGRLRGCIGIGSGVPVPRSLCRDLCLGENRQRSRQSLRQRNLTFQGGLGLGHFAFCSCTMNGRLCAWPGVNTSCRGAWRLAWTDTV
jgi:hypothetical protein